MVKKEGQAKWYRKRKVKEGVKRQRNIEIEDGKTEEKKEWIKKNVIDKIKKDNQKGRQKR